MVTILIHLIVTLEVEVPHHCIDFEIISPTTGAVGIAVGTVLSHPVSLAVVGCYRPPSADKDTIISMSNILTQ